MSLIEAPRSLPPEFKRGRVLVLTAAAVNTPAVRWGGGPGLRRLGSSPEGGAVVHLGELRYRLSSKKRRASLDQPAGAEKADKKSWPPPLIDLNPTADRIVAE